MRHLLLLFLVGVNCAVQAQTYRWTDPATGRTVISDLPPPGNAKNVSRAGASGENTDETPYALRRAMENFPVTLYTAPECMDECKQARELLNKRGVPFKEVSVQTAEQFTELKALIGELRVPVLKVGKEPIRGYNPDTYASALDIAGYPKSAYPGRPATSTASQ